jgi:hypothetical protein
MIQIIKVIECPGTWNSIPTTSTSTNKQNKVTPFISGIHLFYLVEMVEISFNHISIKEKRRKSLELGFFDGSDLQSTSNLFLCLKMQNKH